MLRRRWVHIVGDGLVYEGPCLVHSVIMYPDANQDYVKVYDGRDATSGKFFVWLVSSTKTTKQLTFGDGVPFDQGIYVDAKDGVVETTVVFTPLE